MKNKLHANGLAALLLTLLVTAASTESPVADAAQRGDAESLTALLRQGSDVNAAQGDGMTALHWAAMNGDATMATILVYAGANNEATTRLGDFTPLHLASRNAHAEVVAALLEGGANPRATTATGASPLHLAAGAGSARAVAALIAMGAGVDDREAAHDQTALHWATATNRLDAMQALIDAGADIGAFTKAIDYVAAASADGPDRQRRQRLVVATREAEKDAAAPQNGEPPTETVADQSAAQLQSQDGAAGRAQAQRAQVRQGARETNATVAIDLQTVADRSEATLQNRDQTAQDPDPDAPPPPADPNSQAQQGLPGGATSSTGGTTGVSEPDADGARPLSYTDLVGVEGGLAPLHYASRDGHVEAAMLLLAAGADLNQPTAGDGTTPLLMATINGNYDLAMKLIEMGADPNLASEDGAAPLFATLNNRWAPKSFFPQPTAFKQQEASYLDMMETLLKAGADVNHRTERHIWYASFNFDLLGVTFDGATPFWRAAYALDIPAMQLLVSYGADPNIPTKKTPGRRRGTPGDAAADPSGLEPVPNGGPAVFPIHAATGVGYGGSRAGNSHRHTLDGWLPAVKYLVEELGADVNQRDHDAYSAVHHAAARGDNDLIKYLVSQGAEVSFLSRRGQTTVDMANGPQQRVQPFPETMALLEGLGAKNNHKCVSC